MFIQLFITCHCINFLKFKTPERWLCNCCKDVKLNERNKKKKKRKLAQHKTADIQSKQSVEIKPDLKGEWCHTGMTLSTQPKLTVRWFAAKNRTVRMRTRKEGLLSLVILFSWFLDPSATQPDMLPVRYLVDIAGTSAGCWLSCFTLVSVVI